MYTDVLAQKAFTSDSVHLHYHIKRSLNRINSHFNSNYSDSETALDIVDIVRIKTKIISVNTRTKF